MTRPTKKKPKASSVRVTLAAEGPEHDTRWVVWCEGEAAGKFRRWAHAMWFRDLLLTEKGRAPLALVEPLA